MSTPFEGALPRPTGANHPVINSSAVIVGSDKHWRHSSTISFASRSGREDVVPLRPVKARVAVPERM